MTAYSSHFYDIIRTGASSSAGTVAPLVYEIFKPSTVIDIGCGEGHWAKAFEDLGCEVAGVDGDYVKSPVIDNFIPANLDRAYPVIKSKYDLVISLEVAEHLRATGADGFVDFLSSLGDNLLFSAAIKGQGGVGHVNEQWHDYWLSKFRARGFRHVTGGLRWIIWDQPQVEWWYKQNIFLLSRDISKLSEESKNLFNDRGPTNLVHPTLWESRL